MWVGEEREKTLKRVWGLKVLRRVSVVFGEVGAVVSENAKSEGFWVS